MAKNVEGADMLGSAESWGDIDKAIIKDWKKASQHTEHFGETVKHMIQDVGSVSWHFTEGATSYPINVTAALFQLSALRGNLGEHMYHTAKLRQFILGKILKEVWEHKKYSAEVVATYLLNNKVKMAGKVSGTWVMNNLLLNKLKIANVFGRGGIKLAGAVLSGYGAANLGISYGLMKVEQLIPTVLSGYPEYNVINPMPGISIDNAAEIQPEMDILQGVETLNETNVMDTKK